MNIIQTPIAELYVVEPRIFNDNRGYFFESYNKQTFEQLNLHYNFCQDNQSFSSYGVIRGLHFQKAPFPQAKLVRAIYGKILDVAVDIRPNSKTFLQHFSIILSDENQRQLMIPQGFAHGFSVLSPTAIVSYKCDNYYHPETEAGILYNDEKLGIDWKIEPEKHLVSEKDLKLPTLNDLIL